MRILSVILCLCGAHYVGAKLVWPETYHFKAVLRVPSANITEPYEVWADGNAGNYRFDFYDGMTSIYRRKKENNEIAYYKISPETTETCQNTIVCHEQSIESFAIRKLVASAYLPASGLLRLTGKEVLNDFDAKIWSYVMTSPTFNTTYNHTVWTHSNSVIIMNQLVWVPIRHEYRLFHGNMELDFVRHDYKEFDVDVPAAAIVDLPKDVLCPVSVSKNVDEAIDPILELVNPQLEHSRTSEAFQRFKARHNKLYKSKDEQFKRLNIFRKNLRYINSINRQQKLYRLAANHFADLTEEELSIFRGTEIDSDMIDSLIDFIDDDDDYESASSFNWTAHQAVTPVKDQSRFCGSCYAFATAAAVESAAYVSRGCRHLEEVSEQAILDCTWSNDPSGNHGCEGGKPRYSLEWIKKHGIPFRNEYGPYLGMTGYCETKQPRLLPVYDFNILPRNITFIKKTLRTYGPLVAAMNAPLSHYYYTSGVYTDAACSPLPKKLQHAVLIVGYGKEDGQKYWLVKNSYGPQWGDNGYMKINMKKSSESESSSSSSEEEDEGSLDSRDIGPIRLDPNVCPEGCDRDVYDRTYELRNTRHKHEQNMLEQDRLVELLRKDIDAHNKVKRKLSVQLDKRKNELREFMLEKQNCLNDVDQVIVLRYDQMRASALRGCTGPGGLGRTVVFPEATLARLRKRVLELQDEIQQQKQRQKVNRTHLFRMNVDLRAMEAQAEELRAEMRDVLTRKLGRPRRVDRTLDDLLRQMARRHKFSATLGTVPHVLQQLRAWRKRYSTYEKKYLEVLNHYSERLRLAAALQADVLPQKAPTLVGDMMGGYDADVYQRDVVRLRIVRSQQMRQIKALREEIRRLRVKPQSPRPPPPAGTPPWQEPDDVYLRLPPRSAWRPQTKYFPITPLGSTVKLVYDINIMKLLYDCLDAMRVTRDDAELLLKELNEQLPDVISGMKSRYEVVDMLVKKWLLKYGGDPSHYKKQTRAFDALATLCDRLMREHVETLEGPSDDTSAVLQQLEGALRAVAGGGALRARLAPALAALFHAAGAADLETIETMTSLVNSLVDENHPLTAESIDRIEISDVVEDIKECGVTAPTEDIAEIVTAAVECLRAQLLSGQEQQALREDVEGAIEQAKSMKSTTFTMPSTGRESHLTVSHAHSLPESPSATKSFGRRSVTSMRSVKSVTLKEAADEPGSIEALSLHEIRSSAHSGLGTRTATVHEADVDEELEAAGAASPHAPAPKSSMHSALSKRLDTGVPSSKSVTLKEAQHVDSTGEGLVKESKTEKQKPEEDDTDG